ncbi:MAG: ABC transporter permease [Peptococcaceae bacterium]
MENLQYPEIDPQEFRALTIPGETQKIIIPPGVTHRQDGWDRLKQNRTAMLGLYFIIFIILLAVLVPVFSRYSYSEQFLDKQGQGPGKEFWFGTDSLGRDIFVRVFFGARISLAVAFTAGFINLTIGVLYGGISGYLGGKADHVLMRIVDMFYAVPLILYVILLAVVLNDYGLKSMFIAIGLTYWVEMARVVRGQILSLKEQEFILAARILGADTRRIILRHLLPNCAGTIIVTASLCIPKAIFAEAFLSFIGLGVSAPLASWGVLVSDAVGTIRSYPQMLFFPAAAICITILAFNFLSDGLRDAWDPRLRE